MIAYFSLAGTVHDLDLERAGSSVAMSAIVQRCFSQPAARPHVAKVVSNYRRNKKHFLISLNTVLHFMGSKTYQVLVKY